MSLVKANLVCADFLTIETLAPSIMPSTLKQQQQQKLVSSARAATATSVS